MAVHKRKGYYSVKELAEKLEVTTQTVLYHIAKGHVRWRRFNSQGATTPYYVPESEFQKLYYRLHGGSDD